MEPNFLGNPVHVHLHTDKIKDNIYWNATMGGWNDTILNTTSNIGLNYVKVNTVHTNKNIKTS